MRKRFSPRYSSSASSSSANDKSRELLDLSFFFCLLSFRFRSSSWHVDDLLFTNCGCLGCAGDWMDDFWPLFLSTDALIDRTSLGSVCLVGFLNRIRSGVLFSSLNDKNGNNYDDEESKKVRTKLGKLFQTFFLTIDEMFGLSFAHIRIVGQHVSRLLSVANEGTPAFSVVVLFRFLQLEIKIIVSINWQRIIQSVAQYSYSCSSHLRIHIRTFLISDLFPYSTKERRIRSIVGNSVSFGHFSCPLPFFFLVLSSPVNLFSVQPNKNKKDFQLQPFFVNLFAGSVDQGWGDRDGNKCDSWK